MSEGDGSSLWPVDLARDFPQDHPLNILKGQSKHLEKATEGRLSSWTLATTAPGQQLSIEFGVAAGRKRVRLLTIICEWSGYPATINETIDEASVTNRIDVNDGEGFVKGISDSLSRERIQMILSCLLAHHKLFDIDYDDSKDAE